MEESGKKLMVTERELYITASLSISKHLQKKILQSSMHAMIACYLHVPAFSLLQKVSVFPHTVSR